MKTNLRIAGTAVFAALFALPLLAQQNEGISRQQADAILNELRQIRQLLEKQAKPAEPAEQIVRAKVSVGNAPMLGSKDAPVTIVEFTDYQCPFCQRFHVTTFSELKQKYIDTGKIRFYSRDLPLDSLHANAMRAAQAARCAGEQNHFWELREAMSTNPDKLDLEHILNFAAGLRMDVGALRSCITSDRYKASVQTDVMEAMRIGANGTPAFVVGKSTADGVDGELMLGAMPLAMFEAKLQSLDPPK